ncbi:ArdC family protein [Botrimarina mediterranea]|uniref:ArdC family protein n=1 Tax=Botrimarina mediterranea TaxID=2528022 RepID=UPI0011897802|nr:DNA primase TraC [Planctomycetes bacterium K2D]
MAREKKGRPRRDIYQEVTDRIVGLLEQGVAPWRQPIRGAGGDATPKSLATGKPYRGINVFLLAMTGWAHGYASSYWATFNQVKKEGGSVRKGERSTLVVFWKQAALTDKESGEEHSVPVLRHYQVFNAEQCAGIAAPDLVADTPGDEPFEPLLEAQAIVEAYPKPPAIEHGGAVAAYFPGPDLVRLPAPGRFESREAYYATLFHELAHSTGHEKRLRRGIGERLAPFGSPDYSREELVAELGAAFLCAASGIGPATVEQSAAYLDGWTRALKGDKRLVIQAAGQGQRAADHIRGVKFEDAPGPKA